MQAETVQEAIEAGHEDVESIADYCGVHSGHAGKELKRIVEDPGNPVDREPEGRGHRYLIGDHAAATGEEDGEYLPVLGGRTYDWDRYVPDKTDVVEYVPTDGEWDQITAEIDARHETGKLPRFLVSGPTGSAKTTLAEWIAAERGWPYFEINVAYSMSKADLLGRAVLRAGETLWQDEVLTKALMCSRERPCVVVIDEANRAPARAKSALFSALDYRGEVVLNGRGGEVIEGDPLDLITVATINIGAGYQVEPLDKAEKRRYGNRFDITYLGMAEGGVDEEAELIEAQSPASKRLGEMLVIAANDVRERAEDPTSDVRTGIPVDATITWAQTAAAHNAAEMENPLISAAESSVLNKYYDEREAERDEVDSILRSHLDGAPFETEELREWTGGAEEAVVCMNCDYRADIETAEEQGVLDWMECPECNHDVKRVGKSQLDEEE